MVVHRPVLTKVLREQRIGGPALDLFDKEPIVRTNPLLNFDRVILSPYAVCRISGRFRGNGVNRAPESGFDDTFDQLDQGPSFQGSTGVAYFDE